MKRKLAYILTFLLLVIVAGTAILGRPPLWLETSECSIVIHVETLGEYPTTVRHIQLKSVASGDVLFEVIRGSGAPQIHSFRLSIGKNQVNIADPQAGTYRVLRPAVSDSFDLRQGEKYKLTVWGNGWLPAHANLQLK